MSETLTLPAGSNPSTCVMVVINDDMADENSESFRINLDVLTTPWPTFRTTATVEIIDNGRLSAKSLPPVQRACFPCV